MRGIWAAGNVYLADLEPWKLVERDRARAGAIVRTAINLVRVFAIMSAPVIPEASDRALQSLDVSSDERRWPAELRTEMQALRPGRRMLPADLLFRRVTDDETAAWTAGFAGQESPPVGSPG